MTYDVLEVQTKTGGLLAIRNDAVKTVQADSYGSRNTGCTINGIETEAGYDFVLSALAWKADKVR